MPPWAWYQTKVNAWRPVGRLTMKSVPSVKRFRCLVNVRQRGAVRPAMHSVDLREGDDEFAKYSMRVTSTPPTSTEGTGCDGRGGVI